MKQVAPFTGAWIEINNARTENEFSKVAPFTGAWIEMAEIMAALKGDKSRPSRARGLKTVVTVQPSQYLTSRALHGRVD